ncbi:K02A2.6-like, partial [Cordylochernes scorpioides]
MDQKSGEAISKYIIRLKEQAQRCNFGDFLQESLRDRFVAGIIDTPTQKKLLQEEGLTFEGALDIALSAEAADNDLNNIKRSEDAHRSPQHLHAINNPCKHCGKNNHLHYNCFFKSANCRVCGRVGHISTICYKKDSSARKLPRNPRNTFNKFKKHANDNNPSGSQNNLSLNNINLHPPLTETVYVNNIKLLAEIDTGAAITTLTKYEYFKYFKNVKLNKCNTVLTGYSGSKIPILGKAKFDIKLRNVSRTIEILITNLNCSKFLLGRDFLNLFNISFNYLHKLDSFSIDSLLNDYESIFECKSDPIKGIKCHLDVKADFVPKFYKFRQVPFALKQLVENEIDKLVDLNILSPIDKSDCASPLVCVAKPNGQIRLCADFKKSLNPYLEDVKYPIPNIDSVLSNFQEKKLFTKLDLSKAYHQIEMDDISKKYLVVSTHKGLYKYNRLAFGIKTASEIFQKTMESFFSGIRDVYIYFDDILIASEDLESHLDILKRTLDILKENNFTINKNKCLFVKNEIEYLGHKINELGIYPLKDKLACIKNYPVPKNITELKSFLGFLSFYSKFLPNLSDLAYPLYNLLKKNVKWSWNAGTDRSFNSCKNALDETTCLSHYSLNLPLILSCDASQVGIGATLSHLKDGEERPVCFISRTLNVHERKYSQVEREGLAIVFAVNKLKNYLFGRKFTIYTDHKPLITIFGDKTNLPPLIANRLHRWALTLSNYSFEIKYKKGKDNIIPDFLSRFPEFQEGNLEYSDGSGEILLLNTSIIDHVLVAHETQLDRTLIKLYKIIETGELPLSPNDDLIPYLKRIDDFTILQECIFLENRMVIPKSLHERVLQLLHESHAGTNKMKMMARSSIWWPGMDSSIEIITKNCRTCLSNESLPPQRTESWPKYAGPWRRVHMDYFNFKSKLFLLAVDSFSSWVEVSEVPSTSAYFCINFMRNCIARYGFPQVVVSDNGPPFFSSDFGEFLSKNGISHVTSPPYHPQSNGQAEVSVRELLCRILNLRKMEKENKPSDISEIGKVSVKIPPFLVEKPEIWFFQVETQFKIGGIIQEVTKFNCLISQLEPKYIENIWDIINSKIDNKYSECKSRLLELFREGEGLRIKKLISGIELGDIKPSQLLQKLRSLATPDISDNLIKTLWLDKLPTSIKNILIVSDKEISKLPIMVHKINEINSSKEIYDAEVPSPSTDRLIAKLEDLERQVPPCSWKESGKLQLADKVPTNSSAGIQDCRNLRLFVTDKNTGLRFLVDSGADISIIPPKDKNRMPSSDNKLYAANGTEIVTYGTKVRNVDIGLRLQFQWPFVIANTNRAILGADFLNNFGLIIDIKNKRLIDGITNLSIRGVIQSISDMGNIWTLNSSSKVSAILTKYPNLCRPPSDFVEAKHSVKHYIPTRGQPIHSKARRLDSQRLTLAKAEFQYMLNNGIIRPSNSPLASPLHLVSKRDESLRPCGDYRRLNAVTLPDRYPIPRLDDFHHILKDLQRNISNNLRAKQSYANPPTGVKDAILAAVRGDVTTGSAAATSSNGAARVLGNWADYTEDQGPGEDDDFTVVKNKKRRRDSPGSPAAAAPSSGTRGAGATRRPRSSTGWAPGAEEVRTTRAHIAEARARQASSTEDHCVFVERSPELEPYHYLRAIDRMFGSTREVFQVTKMNGHFLVGLANRGMAERLVNEGLEVEGTLHRAFPFRKRAERITVGNLPFFVGDAAVISALSSFGRVTSIAPKLMKAGPYVYNDGRREAFIILREGMTIERLPTRLDLSIKGEAWPAYLSSGIRCSRCRGQGHRRANCPLLAGRATAPGPATPTSPTSVPPVAAPGLPQQPSAHPPPPASPSPTMETPSASPAARALTPLAAPRPSTPVAPAVPTEMAPPAPPPVTPAPSLRAPGRHEPAVPTLDFEMTVIEETSTSSTSSSKTSTRESLVTFIERNPGVSFAQTDALGLGGRRSWTSSPQGPRHISVVISELRTGPATVPPTSTLPAPRPSHPTPLTSNKTKLTPAMITPPPPAPTEMEEDVPMTEEERCVPPLPAPRLAEPTPPTPQGQKTTPAMATPPPPPSVRMEDDSEPDCWTDLVDLIDELIHGPGLEPILRAFDADEFVDVVRDLRCG